MSSSAAVRALGLSPEAPAGFDIPRDRRVYVNTNLPLARIELVGFDMDYTLALYNQAKIEELSLAATVDKLITVKGYPAEIRGRTADPSLALRGIMVDRAAGNMFKPDRYGYPGRALHGRTAIPKDKVVELYHRERLKLSSNRFAWIDTLFALPEAVLYAELVDHFDAAAGPKPTYENLWNDIRESIDFAHRDGSIKTVVKADLHGYIERDPALGEALHKFRSSGKKLFLLTNSEWEYTNPVMAYLLDGALPAYPSWRHYFDAIVVSARKPEFFTGDQPFVELAPDGAPLPGPIEGPLLRGHVYSGGNIKEFQERYQVRGDRVLYVGDHIFGDMLRSRKSTSWRTAMILQEMEHEIITHATQADPIARLERLDAELEHLETELVERQAALRRLQKKGAANGHPPAQNGDRRAAKAQLDALRAELRQKQIEHRHLEDATDAAFNPHWGPLFREGNEISKFAEQVEAYACVYTSRVSNFRFYSPIHHFRGPRDRLPHER